MRVQWFWQGLAIAGMLLGTGRAAADAETAYYRVYYRASAANPWLWYTTTTTSDQALAVQAQIQGLGFQAQVLSDNNATAAPTPTPPAEAPPEQQPVVPIGADLPGATATDSAPYPYLANYQSLYPNLTQNYQYVYTNPVVPDFSWGPWWYGGYYNPYQAWGPWWNNWWNPYRPWGPWWNHGWNPWGPWWSHGLNPWNPWHPWNPYHPWGPLYRGANYWNHPWNHLLYQNNHNVYNHFNQWNIGNHAHEFNDLNWAARSHNLNVHPTQLWNSLHHLGPLGPILHPSNLAGNHAAIIHPHSPLGPLGPATNPTRPVHPLSPVTPPIHPTPFRSALAHESIARPSTFGPLGPARFNDFTHARIDSHPSYHVYSPYTNYHPSYSASNLYRPLERSVMPTYRSSYSPPSSYYNYRPEYNYHPNYSYRPETLYRPENLYRPNYGYRSEFNYHPSYYARPSYGGFRSYGSFRGYGGSFRGFGGFHGGRR